MEKKFHMILRYFVLKCSQIEYISYIFHTYSTTTPYFALYKLRFLLFSFEIWYTHSYRVFIHLGSRNIIFLHNNQFLSIKWIIKYLIIEIWHFGPSGPTRPSCRCWIVRISWANTGKFTHCRNHSSDLPSAYSNPKLKHPLFRDKIEASYSYSLPQNTTPKIRLSQFHQPG